MRTDSSKIGINWRLFVLTGLSLSIGWGIRGNFGHEWGAAFPGALAALAAVLLSGREDWMRRIAYFAVFGAIGWSFGGSISYMMVIAYTHSGHSLSVWYGFVCLFVIGFLWGSMGGAGTALPACLTRERLTELFPPFLAAFGGLWLSERLSDRLFLAYPKLEDRLDWFDTDWGSVLVVIGAVLLRALIVRRFTRADSLILHMAIGWWIGFLIFPVLLGIRMTPPRGDSWAGCLGMVAGMMLYLWRENLREALFASLVAGFVGGLGFATATLFKLIEMKSGLDTNWHSILEQSYGLINGLGVALTMGILCTRTPKVIDNPPIRRWTEPVSVALILLLMTYINLQKIVGDWTGSKAVPETLYFLTAKGWFDLGYLGIAVVALWLLWEHTRRPFPLIPKDWQGKGQMLYLALLWWMVLGNLFKAIVRFAPQRLVTEGTLHFNALLCTLFLLLWMRDSRPPVIAVPGSWIPLLRRAVLVGVVGMALTTLLDWGIVRALYGDNFAGGANVHIRFGPRNTNTKKK